MNKILRFMPHLVAMILTGKKDITWRLFDDKGLKDGDVIDCYEVGTSKHFATIAAVTVTEKAFKDMTVEDADGHETFTTLDEMYETYSRYYQTKVGPDTLVKVIKFKLLERR